MNYENKTIRYMRKKDLHLTNENSSDELREKIKHLDSETDLVVRLRVDSPIYVEDALELNRINIHKITQQKLSLKENGV